MAAVCFSGSCRPPSARPLAASKKKSRSLHWAATTRPSAERGRADVRSQDFPMTGSRPLMRPAAASQLDHPAGSHTVMVAPSGAKVTVVTSVGTVKRRIGFCSCAAVRAAVAAVTKVAMRVVARRYFTIGLFYSVRDLRGVVTPSAGRRADPRVQPSTPGRSWRAVPRRLRTPRRLRS